MTYEVAIAGRNGYQATRIRVEGVNNGAAAQRIIEARYPGAYVLAAYLV